MPYFCWEVSKIYVAVTICFYPLCCNSCFFFHSFKYSSPVCLMQGGSNLFLYSGLLYKLIPKFHLNTFLALLNWKNKIWFMSKTTRMCCQFIVLKKIKEGNNWLTMLRARLTEGLLVEGSIVYGQHFKQEEFKQILLIHFPASIHRGGRGLVLLLISEASV